MATPAALVPDDESVPPAADPEAIRACLSPRLVAEFDAEWEIVLERAKQDKTLAPVQSMLGKWRHFAYAEMREPGAYYRLLATVERAARTGQAPEGSVPGEQITALLSQRLGRGV